jgi:hypothetical protein
MTVATFQSRAGTISGRGGAESPSRAAPEPPRQEGEQGEQLLYETNIDAH